jgi:maltose alpha-D-glucosyltransferase / alpha-amylase
MQMMFNFHLNQHLFLALATGEAKSLADAVAATTDLPAMSQWALHLRNHDELDLGRLTDAERGQVFAAFGPEPEMQLYDRGIRRRLAPMFDGDRRRIELANSLLFTLPGTPVLRYGDEIGMGDDLSLPERECTRTPMQWSDLDHGGFTQAERPMRPPISAGVYGYQHVNVAAQRRDPKSLLNWFERIIRMRKEVPEVGWGDFEVLDTGHDSVLALRHKWRNNSVVTIHNVSGEAVKIELHLGDMPGRKLCNVLSPENSEADGRGRHHIIMEPYGYRWYRVGGLGYLLDRTDY